VIPFPIILSSPSGGGKTTIARELLRRRRGDLGYSVSCTTRQPRPGEVNGEAYYFISRPEFVAARDRGEFAESAEVHGQLYGTLRREIDRVLGSGRHVVMDIDVQGAMRFAAAYPQSVLVFVLPPSAGVLLERLRGRNSESREALVRRMQSALSELNAVGRYHYVVVNDELERAVEQVSAIIDAESARKDRQLSMDDLITRLLEELRREIDRSTTLTA
jgi:guanylate kinase